ncbi:MAG: Cna B-type domain-containing protein [Eubacteriales bacterium]|nr:Cna B-type domain-containing protein [Eubacteriales bacterium]
MTLKNIKKNLALILAFCVLLVAFSPIEVKAAYNTMEFHEIYKANLNGTIMITGNTFLEPKPDNKPVAGFDNKSNNDYKMVRVDVDYDSTTKVSSSAHLEIPDGAKVAAAYLVWGAATKKYGAELEGFIEGEYPTIKFKYETGQYETIKAKSYNQLKGLKEDYTAYADVSDYVKKSGTYWAADITHLKGAKDLYAAWSLIVVLENKKAFTLKSLSINFGHQIVGAKKTVDVKIGDLQTPPNGDVNAKIGMVVWEGDAGFKDDYFAVKNDKGEFVKLSSDASPEDNFFNSRISDNGQLLENRNPNYVNNMGIDAKTMDLPPGIIPNGAESVTYQFGTDGDWYYPTILTSEIDLYAPDITIEKKVVKLTDTNSNEKALSCDDLGCDVDAGDIVEYEIQIKNDGLDNAIETIFTDQIPEDIEYIANSLSVKRSGDSDFVTLDDPIVENQITVPIGILEAANDGDTQDWQYAIRFKAKVKPEAQGKKIINTGRVSCNGASGAQNLTAEDDCAIFVSFIVDKVWSGDENVTRPDITFTLNKTVVNGNPEPLQDGRGNNLTKDISKDRAKWTRVPELTDGYSLVVTENTKQPNVLDDNWNFGSMKNPDDSHAFPYIENTVVTGAEKNGKLTIKKVLENEPTNNSEENGANAILRSAPLEFTFKVEGPYNFNETFKLTAGSEKVFENLYFGEYTVTEVEANGYTPTYSVGTDDSTKPMTVTLRRKPEDGQSEATVTVTNRNVPNPDDPNPNPNVIDVTVNKIWVGGSMPDTVIQLWREGQEIDGTEIKEQVKMVDEGQFIANGETTSHTFAGLAKHDPSGRPFVYYALEPNVPMNYVATYSSDRLTITNTFEEPEVPTTTTESGLNVPTTTTNQTQPIPSATSYQPQSSIYYRVPQASIENQEDSEVYKGPAIPVTGETREALRITTFALLLLAAALLCIRKNS